MQRPNIIWIYCDELRTDALECYGNPHTTMHTPNIDSLAETGTLFENCFVNAPVCVASRMSILTGLHAEDTGVYFNEAERPNYRLDETYITFPEVFARQGYATANFGKTHLPAEMQPWQRSDESGGTMAELYEGYTHEQLRALTVPSQPQIVIGGRYPGDRPFPAEKVTDNALKYMQSATDFKPYLMRLSYLQPHTPVFPPPPYDTLYADAPFPDALIPAELSQFERRYAEILESHRLTPEQIRWIHIEYYGLVAWIDSQVGRLLEFLREHNQLENTIIIFEADHGCSLGEGGRLQKITFAPESQRVPRLISWPGTLPPGVRRADLCESLDLARTLFDLAGIDAPEHFKGRRLFGDDALPEAVFSTCGYGHASTRTFASSSQGMYDESRGDGWPRRACIRTARYRLDKNVRINGQRVPTGSDYEDVFLADWAQNPAEDTNLANLPELTAVRDDLIARLDAHIANSKEPPEEYNQM